MFLETPGEIGSLVVQAAGFTAAIVIIRRIRRAVAARRELESYNKPGAPAVSWLQHPRVKPEAQAAFYAALAAGFDMAHAQPPERQHRAFREATFSIPAELVRLNPDAPDTSQIRLEDLGPIPSKPSSEKGAPEAGWQSQAPFAPEDTRIFLYSPTKDAKADTVFVTINVDFPIEEVDKKQPTVTSERLDQLALRQATLSAFLTWYAVKGQNPDIKERFQTGIINVVYILRDKAFICFYDPDLKGFVNPGTSSVIFGLTAPQTSRII